MKIIHYIRQKIGMYYRYWSAMHPIAFLITALLLMFFLTIPVYALLDILQISDKVVGGPDFTNKHQIEIFILAVILAPLLETLVGQRLPISLCQKFLPSHKQSIGILSSTILFALMHLSYSIWYFLAILPMGWILALTYTIFQRRKESAFWMTAILHAFKNLLAFIAGYLDSMPVK
ncbi:MAG: CPBP family intramembrane metalloprotease [Chitinophagaceae bacterium]|nr:CPBP family intramembrane metalloprotease [Chitinophagaceae bacterium]